jgi:hypothetical protein
LLPPDKDPYLLRCVLYCGERGAVVTRSISTAVTTENAAELPREHRCRGSAKRPVCRPNVQVSASEVESNVLHLFRRSARIAGASTVARQMLEALAPVWPTLTRGENNEVVRLLVWAAMWDHEKRKVTQELDEIGLERFAEQYNAELGLEPRG